MKVLTLTQPWATLVAIGAKKIETRSWSTSYRGPLAIHAAKGLASVGGVSGLYDLCETEPFHTALRGQDLPHVLPKCSIVAVCELVAIEDTDWVIKNHGAYKIIGGGRRHWPLIDQERAFGDYSPGRYAWLLLNIRALPEPVPCKGQLGLWEYEGEL